MGRKEGEKKGQSLEHGEVGAEERAEVVGVSLGKEIESDDGEYGDDDGHDGEGVCHCGGNEGIGMALSLRLGERYR